MLANIHTATNGNIPPILCDILLIAMIIAFIVGFAELLGLFTLGARAGRFGALVLGVILLVIYVVLC